MKCFSHTSFALLNLFSSSSSTNIMGTYGVFAFFLLVVGVKGSGVNMSPEAYWNSVIPNTRMPTALSDLLHYDQKTSAPAGSGGVNVHTDDKGKSGSTTVDVNPKGVGVNVNKNRPGGGTNVNVGHGGVNVHVNPKKKPTNVNVGPFVYNYAATANQLKHYSNTTVFFLEKKLHVGAKMNLHFTKTVSGVGFLSRKEADETPLLTSANTIRECEDAGVDGERRTCATSLESMVDFATTVLGTRNVVATSTTTEKKNVSNKVYTVSPGIKRLGGDHSKVVACHAEPYVYAVFFCHATQKTRAYTVPLVAADGSKVEAAAVCHLNTSKWNPKHLAFQMLKVKPGTAPICHFLPQDHVVWSVAN